MQALCRSSGGTRASRSGEKRMAVHQQAPRCACGSSQAIAQAFSPPHSGQRAGSTLTDAFVKTASPG